MGRGRQPQRHVPSQRAGHQRPGRPSHHRPRPTRSASVQAGRQVTLEQLLAERDLSVGGRSPQGTPLPRYALIDGSQVGLYEECDEILTVISSKGKQGCEILDLDSGRLFDPQVLVDIRAAFS